MKDIGLKKKMWIVVQYEYRSKMDTVKNFFSDQQIKEPISSTCASHETDSESSMCIALADLTCACLIVGFTVYAASKGML